MGLQSVGVKLMCPECRELDGNKYRLDKAPSIPFHPGCRCTLFADPESLGLKEDISVEEQEAAAAVVAEQTPAGIVMSPSEIAEKARKKRSQKQQIGKWVKTGEFENLTLSQLRDIAKKWGLSIYRTKEDFVRMLAPLEPNVDWDNIKGMELRKLLKKHKIGSMKSKEELVRMLKNKKAIKILEKISEKS